MTDKRYDLAIKEVEKGVNIRVLTPSQMTPNSYRYFCSMSGRSQDEAAYFIKSLIRDRLLDVNLTAKRG